MSKELATGRSAPISASAGSEPLGLLLGPAIGDAPEKSPCEQSARESAVRITHASQQPDNPRFLEGLVPTALALGRAALHAPQVHHFLAQLEPLRRTPRVGDRNQVVKGLVHLGSQVRVEEEEAHFIVIKP